MIVLESRSLDGLAPAVPLFRSSSRKNEMDGLERNLLDRRTSFATFSVEIALPRFLVVSTGSRMTSALLNDAASSLSYSSTEMTRPNEDLQRLSRTFLKFPNLSVNTSQT